MHSEGSLLTVKGIACSVQEAEIWSCYFLAPSPLGLNSLFSHSPLLFLVIVGYPSVSLFNTSVFSGCAFALGSQRASLCEGTGV